MVVYQALTKGGDSLTFALGGGEQLNTWFRRVERMRAEILAKGNELAPVAYVKIFDEGRLVGVYDEKTNRWSPGLPIAAEEPLW
jgi:hypothetical protein